MKAWKKIVDVSIAYPQFPSISLIELTYAILDLPPPLSDGAQRRMSDRHAKLARRPNRTP